jgi:hypothetical protein
MFSTSPDDLSDVIFRCLNSEDDLAVSFVLIKDDSVGLVNKVFQNVDEEVSHGAFWMSKVNGKGTSRCGEKQLEKSDRGPKTDDRKTAD